ncbi:MAG: helix-turn-helix domain-containing protein, partial [Clostridia bacterium]|nr:helix-turn-helix domain-containing protein [Clostridia bacterium]
MRNIDKTLAKQIINTVEEVCGHGINFIDRKGIIFASTDENRVGDFHEIGFEAAKTGEVIEVHDDEAYGGTRKGVNIPIFHRNEIIAVIGISGEPEEVRQYTKLAVRIAMLLIREQEIGERNRSIQEKHSYIIRSMISGSIENRDYFNSCIKELKIDSKQNMKLVVIKLNPRYNIMNVSLIEQQVEKLLSNEQVIVSSYIYPNEYVALISEASHKRFTKTLMDFAEENKPIFKIGVGSPQKLGRLHISYELATTAIIGIVQGDEYFSDFDSLDLDILLGSIPENTQRAYIQKIAKALSEEDKRILGVYYKNQMSLGKASGELYIHKNTLQYRLDKIAAKSGYNPR